MSDYGECLKKYIKERKKNMRRKRARRDVPAAVIASFTRRQSQRGLDEQEWRNSQKGMNNRSEVTRNRD